MIYIEAIFMLGETVRVICIKHGFGLHALLINEEWVSVVFFECNKQFYLKSLKSHVLQILIHL